MQPRKELSQVQQEYLVDVIMTWIQKEMECHLNKKPEEVPINVTLGDRRSGRRKMMKDSLSSTKHGLMEHFILTTEQAHGEDIF